MGGTDADGEEQQRPDRFLAIDPERLETDQAVAQITEDLSEHQSPSYGPHRPHGENPGDIRGDLTTRPPAPPRPGRQPEEEQPVGNVAEHQPEEERHEEGHEHGGVESPVAREGQHPDEQLERTCGTRVREQSWRLFIRSRLPIGEEDLSPHVGLERCRQLIELPPRHPADQGEGSFGGSDIAQRVQLGKPTLDAPARRVPVSAKREQLHQARSRLLDLGRQVRQPLLHRSDGRRQRQIPVFGGKMDAAHLLLGEHGVDAARLVAGEHEHRADGVRVHLVGDDLESSAQQRRQLITHPADYGGVAPFDEDGHGLEGFEFRERGHQRGQAAQRLDVPRQRAAFGLQLVDCGDQGLDRGRQLIEFLRHFIEAHPGRVLAIRRRRDQAESDESVELGAHTTQSGTLPQLPFLRRLRCGLQAELRCGVQQLNRSEALQASHGRIERFPQAHYLDLDHGLEHVRSPRVKEAQWP